MLVRSGGAKSFGVIPSTTSGICFLRCLKNDFKNDLVWLRGWDCQAIVLITCSYSPCSKVFVIREFEIRAGIK